MFPLCAHIVLYDSVPCFPADMGLGLGQGGRGLGLGPSLGYEKKASTLSSGRPEFLRGHSLAGLVPVGPCPFGCHA